MTELWTYGYVWVVYNMWCYLLRGDSMCLSLNYKARLQPFMTYCSGAPCADMEPKHLIPSLSLVVLHVQWLEFQKKNSETSRNHGTMFFLYQYSRDKGFQYFHQPVLIHDCKEHHILYAPKPCQRIYTQVYY